jgi:mannosyltransferase OCH1-like enzyme
MKYDNLAKHHQIATTASDRQYVRRHHNDASVLGYIQQKCGLEAASAYSRLAPPAYRADMFRFCALYADDGVYLDEDIFPVVPLEELYSTCLSQPLDKTSHIMATAESK